jgi:hypothetical protein
MDMDLDTADTIDTVDTVDTVDTAALASTASVSRAAAFLAGRTHSATGTTLVLGSMAVAAASVSRREACTTANLPSPWLKSTAGWLATTTWHCRPRIETLYLNSIKYT